MIRSNGQDNATVLLEYIESSEKSQEAYLSIQLSHSHLNQPQPSDSANSKRA